MSNFKNPFLSANDHFLMKKNYNVIYPSSTNQSYNSTSTFHSNNYSKTDQKNIIDQKMQDLKKQNPFQSKQNKIQKYNYSNNSPIVTQTQNHLYDKLMDRGQTFRSSSLNNNNFNLRSSRTSRALQVSNTSIEARIDLKNNYYSGNNNDWNVQKWKKQLQKKDRKDLQIYGPQALRYKKFDYKTESYLPYRNDLNNQYYSISHLPSIENHENLRQTPTFTKNQHKNKRKKQIFEEDDFVIQKKKNNIKRSPSQPLFKNNGSDSNESYYNKANKIRQSNEMMNSIKQNQFQNLQSKIGQFNMASRLGQTSKHSEQCSIQKSEYDMYKSKCDGIQNDNARPLNMNAFDSQIQRNMGDSSVFKTKKYYGAKTDSQSDDYKLIKVIKPNQRKRHVGFLQTDSNVKRSSILNENRDIPVRQNKNYPKIIKFRGQQFLKIQLSN